MGQRKSKVSYNVTPTPAPAKEKVKNAAVESQENNVVELNNNGVPLRRTCGTEVPPPEDARPVPAGGIDAEAAEAACVVPAYVTKESFEKILQENVNNFDKITNMKAYPAMAPGENYATLMLRVNIDVQLKGNCCYLKIVYFFSFCN